MHSAEADLHILSRLLHNKMGAPNHRHCGFDAPILIVFAAKGSPLPQYCSCNYFFAAFSVLSVSRLATNI